MLSGEVLSRWLQHRDGTVLRGASVRLSRSGLLRVSTVDDSRPVRVLLPVRHGGQAAVARAELADAGDSRALALRVGAVTSREEQSRQMERLLSMLSVATAARERPEVYPSVLPVVESFVCTVPGAELGSRDDEHELWCDVMVWCGTNLAELQQVEGAASRAPAVVVGRMTPVVATVRAVHENLGVIHRDITPHNVLVDDTGRLMLADWGIAHLIADDKTSTHTQRLGNLGFSVPPETLRGDTAVGRYTDAWYLGSLLVWQLTGQAPDTTHGPDWLPAGLDQAGEQLTVVARGLCRLDPHQRMGLPEAAARLGKLVGQPGPVAVVGPVAPLAPSLRTSDSTVLTAPAPALPGTPDRAAAPVAVTPLGSPPAGPADRPPDTVALGSMPTVAGHDPAPHPGIPGPSVAAPPSVTPGPAGRPVSPRPGLPNPAPLTALPETATPAGTGQPAQPARQPRSFPGSPAPGGLGQPAAPAPGPPNLSPTPSPQAPGTAGRPAAPAQPGQPGQPRPALPGLSAPPPAAGTSARPAPLARPMPQSLTPPSLWQPSTAPASTSQRRQVVGSTPGIGGQGGAGPEVAATELVGGSRPSDRAGYTVPYPVAQSRGSAAVSERPPSFAPPATTPPARRRGRGVLVAVAVVAVLAVAAVVTLVFQLAG